MQSWRRRTAPNFEFSILNFEPVPLYCFTSYDAPRRTYNSGVQGDSNQASASRRLLALDVGSRTIGLAISDPLGITAQGLVTIRRTSKRADLQRLADLIREYQVGEIVVGYPLHMSGEAGVQAQRVEALAAEMHRRFHLPVHLWDERLTSAEANRVLRETDMSIRRRGQVVDQLAAVLILQAFMQNRASSAERPAAQP
jgi:putative Holliday junction resolvase